MAAGSQPEGTAVDARGAPAVEPSENVKALSEASNKRQDDLREITDKLFKSRIDGLKDLMDCRDDCRKNIADAESRRVNEQASLRSYYSERLEIAEAKRIDAIRAVDVNAVAVANQRASDQATVLATQVVQSAEQLRTQGVQSAEALRALVASTAATAEATRQQQFESLSTRLTTLEQAGWQGVGKQSYADPAFAELLNEVKGLRESRREVVGVNQGISSSWGVIAVVITIIIAATGTVLSFNRSPSSASAPQVVYVPSSTTGSAPAPGILPK